MIEGRGRRAASPRSGAERKTAGELCERVTLVRPSVQDAPPAGEPGSSCRFRWRRTAQSDRRGRAGDRAVTAPASRDIADRDPFQRDQRRVQPRRLRKAIRPAAPRPARTIGSSRASALSRLWAWRAFVALARKRSTKACSRWRSIVCRCANASSRSAASVRDRR